VIRFEPRYPSARTLLVSPGRAAILDREASQSWGLSPFALVEAAGRACAGAFLPHIRDNETILACAGPGNNGADALVMLRSLLMNDPRRIRSAMVLLSRFPAEEEKTPRSEALRALKAMGLPVAAWNDGAAEMIQTASLVIDGLAGTGMRGALEGIPLEMVNAVNGEKAKRRDTQSRNGTEEFRIVSVDIPSGAGEPAGAKLPDRESSSPVIYADYTLAIEPFKTVLYVPVIRPCCGKIIPVNGIFPPALLEKYGDAELLYWEQTSRDIPPVSGDDYKYSRGVTEIHAGSSGAAGAARIAAAGAGAAGAGLVRLAVDDELYPVLASNAGGVMVLPASTAEDRFKPDALLLGPGWGRGKGRRELLQKALQAENGGLPLILDADGIGLLQKDTVFHGRTILTPHAGELEALSGIPKERLLSEPVLIGELAERFNAVILFKSHVMILAEPGSSGAAGRTGFIDGMNPLLAAGGSGDLLAGFCAAIAGRMHVLEKQAAIRPATAAFDPYKVAAAGGTLLIASAGAGGKQFCDPLDLAKTAAVLAGEAWLP
jgi:NAD(P)H-hydrate epimerase